jgi:DNA-binding NarL/FixJ family response regulator
MNANTPIRVLAADDHPLLRDGIAALIGPQSDMKPSSGFVPFCLT